MKSIFILAVLVVVCIAEPVPTTVPTATATAESQDATTHAVSSTGSQVDGTFATLVPAFTMGPNSNVLPGDRVNTNEKTNGANQLTVGNMVFLTVATAVSKYF